MNYKDVKIFGVIGGLFILIGLISMGLGFFVGIIGLILVVYAVKYFSEFTKDKSIFNNFLLFFIISIIGIGVSGGIIGATFIQNNAMDTFNALQTQAYTNPQMVWDAIQPFLPGVIIGVVILWATLIIGVVFLRISFDKISEYTKVKRFNTTGLLFLIGAVTIIIGLGFFILLIGLVYLILAFASLPDNLPKDTV
jgi:uncharacterized membrane protein